MGLKVDQVLGSHIETLFNEDTVHVLKRYELELLQGTKRLEFEMVLTNGNEEERDLIVYEAPFMTRTMALWVSSVPLWT